MDERKNLNNIKTALATKPCHRIYCGNDWRSHIRKIVKDTGACVDDCSGYRYENNNYCYSTCPEGATFCSPDPETTNMIVTTKNNKEITTFKINPTTFNPIHPTTFNPIYPTTINVNYPTTINVNYPTTINVNYPTTYNLNYPTTINANYPTTSHLNIDSNIAISLDDSIDKFTNNLNISTFPQSYYYKSEEIQIEQTYLLEGKNNEEIYKIIKSIMKNNYYYNYKGGEGEGEGEEKIIKGKDDFMFQITTTKNERDALSGKSDNNDSFSKIDLGECEDYLKDSYHIEKNLSLIIIKFEKITNISIERTLQYEVYEPLNKTQLNLSICENTTIMIYTPVTLSEKLQNLYSSLKENGYELFNINSAFYQDICTPFKSPEGTDVLLSDRINDYYNNNETLCQPNCEFSNYSVETKLLKCNCDVSNSIIDTKLTKKFTKESVYQSFYDSLKFSNYKVLKCYKLAFHINSITKNKGSIIAIIYFLFYVVFLIIYIIKGIKKIKIHFAKELFDKNINPNKDSKFIYNPKITERKDKNIYITKMSTNQQTTLSINSKKKPLITSPEKKIKRKLKNFPPKKKKLWQKTYQNLKGITTLNS